MRASVEEVLGAPFAEAGARRSGLTARRGALSAATLAASRLLPSRSTGAAAQPRRTTVAHALRTRDRALRGPLPPRAAPALGPLARAFEPAPEAPGGDRGDDSAHD